MGELRDRMWADMRIRQGCTIDRMVRLRLVLVLSVAVACGGLGAQRSVSASSVGTEYCCDGGGHCPWDFQVGSRIIETPTGEAGFIAEPDLGNLEPYELLLIGIPAPPINMSVIDPAFPTNCVLHLWPSTAYVFAQPPPVELGVPFAMIPRRAVFRFQTAILPSNSPRMSRYVEFVWP